MPFGPYETFQACLTKQAHDHPSWTEEQRKKYCGAIKARTEGTRKEGDSLLQKHFEDLYADLDSISIDLDAILKNQPIAKEGVLDYGNIKKYKRWENLKSFDTISLPIIDDHPSQDNGNDGLWKDEKVWGYATVKICPKEKRILCADLDLDDDAPVRNGYSLGYKYAPILKEGSKNGVKFQMIQDIKELDHLALTNFPRDSYALRRTDNDSNNTDNTERNNMFVGYDHFKTFFNRSLTSDQSKKNSDVKNMGNDAKTPDSPEHIDADTIASLRLKIQKLESQKEFDAKLKEKMDAVQKELDAEKADKLKLKKSHDSMLNQLISTNLDSLNTEFGIDKAEFDKKSPDFIEGALFMGRKLKQNDSLKPRDEAHNPDEQDQQSEGDATDFDHRTYEWDNEKEELVDPFTGKSIREG